ncbi:hypothetical protein [Pseudomonas boanensis]|uniref:hypothetical protein n=1 Tax=Metapseudomonas boanensis TaxID=2822138 RepID=UPI0035D51665
MDEGELQGITGRDGLSLSLDINFAATPEQTRCLSGCGTRIAFQPANGAGFIVIDNIRGTFSFDGVQLDVVKIDSGFDGDGAAFNATALRLALTPARFSNAQFTLASSNQVHGDQPGHRQTGVFTYHTDGEVRLHGNLYLFGTR